MIPGSGITITFDDNHSADIKIGITGSYYIDTGVKINSVVLK
jgi:hypothetical protein